MTTGDLKKWIKELKELENSKPDILQGIITKRPTKQHGKKALDEIIKEGCEQLKEYEHITPPMTQAITMYRNGNYQQVMELLLPYGRPKKFGDRISFLIGSSFLAMSKFNDALSHFKKITEITQFKPGINKSLAQCYEGLNKFSEAKKYCAEYLNKIRDDHEVIKLQLRIAKKRFEASNSEEERNQIFAGAREFAEQATKKKLLSFEEVEEIWPGLIDGGKE